MNKTLRFLAICLCLVAMPAVAAVSIKKAAPVATQQSSKMDSAGSLVGTALNLVATVKDLTAKIDALTAECEPTSSEISFVNDMIKEWAKTGVATSEEVANKLNRRRCDDSDGVGGYQASVKNAIATDGGVDICFDSFKGAGNLGMVWEDFPRVGTATYCEDKTETCGKKAKKTSDIYEIFALIDFSEEDYTPQELTSASKLIAKAEKCGGSKIDQVKKNLWGTFVKDSVGNMGQKTSTASIMDTVTGVIGNGGGAMGGLSSIGSFITNTMNK